MPQQKKSAIDPKKSAIDLKKKCHREKLLREQKCHRVKQKRHKAAKSHLKIPQNSRNVAEKAANFML